MPDRRRHRRLLAAIVLASGVGTLLTAPLTAPSVGAAPEDWAGSAFTQATASVHRQENFPVEGMLVRTRSESEISSRRIQDVNLDFAFRPGEETAFAPTCIPDPTVNAEVQEQETFDEDTATSTRTFSLAADQFAWTCNGTFDIVATGTSTPPDRFELAGTIRVGVPPVAVPSLDATVSGGEEAPDPETGATADDPASVVVTWDESPEDAADFQGYRVQRAGLAAGSTFETVSEIIGPDAAREHTDTIETSGEYRYRVQSLRAGPDGSAPAQLVPSTDADTATVTVEIAGSPTNSTTSTTTPSSDGPPTTRRQLDLPGVGRGTNNPQGEPLTVPSPPTTVDTGFGETLDYGDLPEPGDELAGEGQSVIQNEGPEGAGLLGPVAGAMVLLGWASHVAYLNRLAKQF